MSLTAAEVKAIVQKVVSLAAAGINELFNNKLAELAHRVSDVESVQHLVVIL